MEKQLKLFVNVKFLEAELYKEETVTQVPR